MSAAIWKAATSARKITNFERLRSMNFNEAATFLSKGLGLKEEKVSAWLDANSK